MRKHLCFVGAVLIASCLYQAPASAGIIILDTNPIELTDLLAPGATVEVEDKEFSNFFYNPQGDMPTAEGIQVFKIKDDSNGNVGIRFQGLFKDVADATNNGSDAVIMFDVEATDPSQWISDVHLFANVNSSTNAGPASFHEVVETVRIDSMTSLHLSVDENNRDAWVVFADEGVAPQRKIQVTKDIGLWAQYIDGVTQPNDRVTISVIDQLFSQVPEPGTFGMLAAMALGLLGYARRR